MPVSSTHKLFIAPTGRSGFPASDPGFEPSSVAELLELNQDLIARIQLCYGATEEEFEKDIMVLLRRYAAYVHLLPATANNYFSHPGGLLRLGLETAFFSLQGTDAHIFSGRLTISERRRLEPRWRQATFIAGLCCELHHVLSHMVVTDASGEPWPAYLQPLADWLSCRNAERYYLTWRPQAQSARGLGLFAFTLVVPAEAMQHLSTANTVIVPLLMASVGGTVQYRDRNVLDDLVRRSLALIIDRNLIGNADRYGVPQFGSHLERYLVDALRRLASAHSGWIPNREKSRVWLASDGLFLVWPGAAEDVHELLETDQLPGIPKAPQTMLELLLAAGVFIASDSGEPTWSIHPPGAKAPLAAAKLATPAILLAGIEPAPAVLHAPLVRGAVDGSAAMAPIPPAHQMPLVVPEVPALRPERQADTPAVPSPSPPSASPALAPKPTLTLQAPMRLNPAVREALRDLLEMLASDGDTGACRQVPDGIFIPLDELERRGLPPAQALRSLADARMLALAPGSGTPVQAHDIDGHATQGLVISRRFVHGLVARDTPPPASAEV